MSKFLKDVDIEVLVALFIFVYMWGSATIMMSQYYENIDLKLQIQQLQENKND